LRANSENAQVDELLLRYLECSDRASLFRKLGTNHRTDKRGWITRGQLPGGRKWGVKPLACGDARLHIWTSGWARDTREYRHYDYCHPLVATLAVLEWEGLSREPQWWSWCLSTNRRRTYLSDGSFSEEVRP